MICKSCRQSIPDDSTFCLCCGQKIEVESTVTPVKTIASAFRQAGSLDGDDSGLGAPTMERKPETSESDLGLRFSSSFKQADSDPVALPVEEPAVPVAPKFETNYDNGTAVTGPAPANRCPHCGGLLDPDAKFCNNCGKKLGNSLLGKAVKKFAGIKAHKIPKTGIIAVASIALLLAVVLVVGFATNWFRAAGPAAQIVSAAKNTFTADNFSVDFNYAYISDGDYEEEVSGTAYIAIDPKKRDITFYADLTADGESGIIAIYDGYYLESDYYDCWGEDISEEIEDFFDEYKEYIDKDFSWEHFIDSIYYEGAYDEAKEDINFAIMDDCMASYMKKLNDKKWLEENAGYLREENDGIVMHCFNPDIYRFLKLSAKEFKDAFVDREIYSELDESITDLRAESKHTNTNIVFSIDDGNLVHFRGGVSGPYEGLTGGDDYIVEADFYDFGKTKFDTEELDDMLAEVRKNGY